MTGTAAFMVGYGIGLGILAGYLLHLWRSARAMSRRERNGS